MTMMSTAGAPTGSFLAAYDAADDADKVKILFLWVATKPMELFAELRAHRPVLVTPGQGPVLLTRFADVEEALSRPMVFTVRPYAPKMDPTVGPFMLGRDGTVFNQRDKGILRAMMQQADLPKVREMVAEIARDTIAAGAADGRLEIISQLTRRTPAELTGRYFGFPGPDIATLLKWSYATQYDMFHNLSDDATIHANSVAAGAAMKDYLTWFLADRRTQTEADPSIDDVVVRLLRLKTPEVIGFDFDRIMTNTMGLLVGGIETTSAACAQAVDQLIDRPAALASALKAAKAGDDATFDATVWEALRFNPINPFVGRLSVAPYTIAAGTDRATEIAPGRLVLISTTSAMHDGTVVPNPEAFDTTRPDYHYFHLGYGLHRCLGDQVSLMQVPEVVKQLLLAGFTKRADGPAGHLDFQNGPFPESFTLVKG